jgi:hypothetical protein
VNTVPGTWSGLYTYYSDAEQITEQLTRAFLEQLQAQLDASGQNTTNRADLNEIIAEITEVGHTSVRLLSHSGLTTSVLLRRADFAPLLTNVT